MQIRTEKFQRISLSNIAILRRIYLRDRWQLLFVQQGVAELVVAVQHGPLEDAPAQGVHQLRTNLSQIWDLETQEWPHEGHHEHKLVHRTQLHLQGIQHGHCPCPDDARRMHEQRSHLRRNRLQTLSSQDLLGDQDSETSQCSLQHMLLRVQQGLLIAWPDDPLRISRDLTRLARKARGLFAEGCPHLPRRIIHERDQVRQ
mmetsp:Transcript_105695/g.192323  ORF Transcript_105695/g.192323 Transcript_105695/m.192323 type:complete len:201 (-) Transcript_105695:282-884(-)